MNTNNELPPRQRGTPAPEPTVPPRRPARASGGLQVPSPTPPNLLSLDECEALVRALSGGQGPFTQKQAEDLWAWAESVRMGNTLVELLLNGLLNAGYDEGGRLVVSAVPLDEAVNHLAEIQRRRAKPPQGEAAGPTR